MSVEPVIRSLTPAISIFSVPFKRFGLIPFGGRSTAIKLASGDLWIVVSHPLTESTKAELARLGGNVKYLVTPDLEHTMSISAWHKAFPEAICVGPEGVKAKIQDVPWAGEYKTNGRAAPAERFGFEDEIETAYFSSHANKDIAFFHKPSKTLVQADLLFNLKAINEQHPGGLGLSGIASKHVFPGSSLHKKLIWGIGSADRHAFAEANAVVESWDFDRIIPCHGDVVDTGGKEAWRSTFADYAHLLATGSK